MAAIDFPNTPSVGDLFTVNDITWEWDGVVWTGIGTPVAGPQGEPGTPGEQGEISSFIISEQPPTEDLIDGSFWLDTDGNVQPAMVDIVRWNKTATSNQTDFNGASDGGGPTLSYVPGNEQVFLNGVQLIRGSDYTANDGESVVLNSAASAGDTLQAVILPSVGIINSVEKFLFESKGDILSSTGASTPLRLSVGENNTFLKANSATPTGLVWAPIDVSAAEENYIRYIMGV
jgi:hypothetical protein